MAVLSDVQHSSYFSEADNAQILRGRQSLNLRENDCRWLGGEYVTRDGVANMNCTVTNFVFHTKRTTPRCSLPSTLSTQDTFLRLGQLDSILP